MRASDFGRRKLELSLPVDAVHPGRPYGNTECELLGDLAASLRRDLPRLKR